VASPRFLFQLEINMYENIEAHAVAFDNLRVTLGQPDSALQVSEICSALEATAQKIADTQGETAEDRNNLSRLYRGFLAASRVVGHLQEKHSAQGF